MLSNSSELFIHIVHVPTGRGSIKLIEILPRSTNQAHAAPIMPTGMCSSAEAVKSRPQQSQSRGYELKWWPRTCYTWAVRPCLFDHFAIHLTACPGHPHIEKLCISGTRDMRNHLQRSMHQCVQGQFSGLLGTACTIAISSLRVLATT